MAEVIVGLPVSAGFNPNIVPSKSRSYLPTSAQTIAGGVVPSVTNLTPIENRVLLPAKTPKVTFVSESGVTIRIPFAPSEIQIDRLAPVYSTIERPAKQELLLWERDQLTQVTLTVFIAAENQIVNPLGSVEEWISNFRRHVQSRTRWKFQYGPQVEKYWWRFTDVSIKTQLRTPDTNEIAVATADIQLTQASDVNIQVGPITGGVPPNTSEPSGTGTYSTYTIKSSSDTLWVLAARFLGNGNRWKEIAALNNITDTRKIKIGQVIKIPGNR